MQTTVSTRTGSDTSCPEHDIKLLLNSNQPMSPSSVEHLLTQKVRLLARRETPVIDQELENLRQAALEVFFQWQDGVREFQDLTPFVAILEKKVDLNRSLLKWEQEHITD